MAGRPSPRRKRSTGARHERREAARPTTSGFAAAGIAIALHVGLVAWGVWQGRITGEVVAGLLLLDVIAFAAYAFDKRAARGGRWRIPEAHLHLLEALGGWPGALVARHLLRHKSAKRAYGVVLWAIVALHLLATLLFLFR